MTLIIVLKIQFMELCSFSFVYRRRSRSSIEQSPSAYFDQCIDKDENNLSQLNQQKMRLHRKLFKFFSTLKLTARLWNGEKLSIHLSTVIDVQPSWHVWEFCWLFTLSSIDCRQMQFRGIHTTMWRSSLSTENCERIYCVFCCSFVRFCCDSVRFINPFRFCLKLHFTVSGETANNSANNNNKYPRIGWSFSARSFDDFQFFSFSSPFRYCYWK